MQLSSSTLSLENILTMTQEKMLQLLNTLKKETQILKENNIDVLEELAQEKLQLTEDIEKSEKNRIRFLEAKSLNPNEPTQWLKTNKLLSIWENIKLLSEQAKKQNQINGIVINGNHHSIKTKINILSASLPSTELTYSSSGENINQRDSTTLAHA